MRMQAERLRIVQDQAPVGICEIDLEGRYLRVNDRFCEITGYSRDELLARRFQDITHPEDVADDVEAYRRQAKKDFPYRIEKRYLHKDGHTVWIELNGYIVRDEQGRPQFGVGIVQDITERKRAEEVLRQSEARFRMLVETAQEGIWSVNAIGRTDYVNQRMAEMLGYAQQDLLGCSVFEFTFDEDRDTALHLFQQCLAGGKMQCDVRFRRADGGELWVGVAANRIMDGNGEVLGALALFSDVTERRRAEEALKEADRRKNEFLAMLGHELRNPLAPIRTAVQAMRKLDVSDPKQHWARDVVDRQVNHLVRLVDDILDVSRIIQGKLTLKTALLEAAAIIDQAVETTRPLMDARRHTLAVSVPEQPIRLLGDDVRLIQVFSNLLDNAAKYTPEGGNIWLTVTPADDEVAISVRDTGEGIGDILLPYLFDIFTQAERSLDRSQGGLGLGLTIVQKIVEMHGGSIEARSEGLGKGSEFIVRLPVLA